MQASTVREGKAGRTSRVPTTRQVPAGLWNTTPEAAYRATSGVPQQLPAQLPSHFFTAASVEGMFVNLRAAEMIFNIIKKGDGTLK